MNSLELQHTMQVECGLAIDQPLLIGVSGGPDSLCLLDILDKLGYHLVVAHFDHCLRQESSQEAALVQAQAGKRGLHYVFGRLDVRQFAAQEKLSLEEAARIARYRFLFEQARQSGAQAVAVAHTADDQVETVLMHLLRGTGLSGLKGMSYSSLLLDWDAIIPLVRPLLGVWRTEILAYCAQNQLTAVFDPSNADSIFLRNRLRHELIPELEKYNPQLKEALWRMSQTLAADNAVLEDVMRQTWTENLIEQTKEYVLLSLPGLKMLSRGLLRGIIRKAAGGLHSDLSELDFKAIERGVEYVDSSSARGRVDLASGLYMLKERNQFYIALQGAILADRDWPQIVQGEEFTLEAPARISLNASWFLESEWVVVADLAELDRVDPFQAWLAADALELPLQIRTLCRGDRFQPLGMESQSVKLSDFFINEKLPQRARSAWPLFCSQGKIVWVPGFRPAHFCRLQKTGCKALHLRLARA